MKEKKFSVKEYSIQVLNIMAQGLFSSLITCALFRGFMDRRFLYRRSNGRSPEYKLDRLHFRDTIIHL